MKLEVRDADQEAEDDQHAKHARFVVCSVNLN
jgi:hypothetical protein